MTKNCIRRAKKKRKRETTKITSLCSDELERDNNKKSSITCSHSSPQAVRAPLILTPARLSLSLSLFSLFFLSLSSSIAKPSTFVQPQTPSRTDNGHQSDTPNARALSSQRCIPSPLVPKKQTKKPSRNRAYLSTREPALWFPAGRYTPRSHLVRKTLRSG